MQKTAAIVLLRPHFLPPYCPDDNRIERCSGGELHANVTRNHCCRDIEQLMNEVEKLAQMRVKLFRDSVDLQLWHGKASEWPVKTESSVFIRRLLPPCRMWQVSLAEDLADFTADGPETIRTSDLVLIRDAL